MTGPGLRGSMAATILVLATAPIVGQGGGGTGRLGLPPRPLPDGPVVYEAAEEVSFRVTSIKGLVQPWGMAFLPNGDMLVTERPGRLRIVRDGKLDPQAISGVPASAFSLFGGLLEITLHPRFATNRLVYLTYTKALAGDEQTSALARGRLEGMSLVDVKEIFAADVPTKGGPAAGAPMLFGRNGHLYMAIRVSFSDAAQKPDSHAGKIVRLRDDGTVPSDNPFVGQPGFKPEIYSLGHRNPTGLALHPDTGEVWASEHGPQGGDEVNVLKAGANFGWPIVSLGREYTGPRASQRMWHEGMLDPAVAWLPSIAASGMTFYTGDRFPKWKNNLFVGGMQTGRIPGTGRLERIVFNNAWEEIRRESLLTDLRQRIRNVRQGPDGLLYVLTDEVDGAILKLEPAQ